MQDVSENGATEMTKRQINFIVFTAIYVLFLAWYDGWGRGPLTSEEVDGYLARVPENAQGVEFLENLREMGKNDDGGEFFMLNLNRYEYAEGESTDGAPTAYQEYGAGVVPMILGNAGHPIYSAAFLTGQLAGGPDDPYWDETILVRYRSRRDFIDMVTSKPYLEIAGHRAGGISHAEVAPTIAAFSLASPRLIVFLLLLVPALLRDRRLKQRSSASH